MKPIKNKSFISPGALCLILTSIFFVACKQTPQNISEEKGIEFKSKAQADSLINHFVNDGHYPVMYALIEDKEGKPLYEHAAINQDIYPNQTIGKDTWFRVWSMSKIITISIALDLIEEGLLRFDDPVTKFIPEFKNLKVAVTMDGKGLTDQHEEGNEIQKCPIKLVPTETEMTILHLINHQAGFYYATTGIDCIDNPLKDLNIASSKDNQAFINKLASIPLIQQPGTTDFYGINTTVLGFVAERVTGQSLKQLVKERVTDPLKIQGLQYGLPEDATLLPPVSGKDTVLRLAHRGELDIFGLDVPDYDPEHALYLGGEGMVGTADGYTDFIRMLLNRGTLNGHRFLDAATVKDFHSPHTQLDNPWGHNGYNLWVSGDSLRIHGGGDEGLWLGGGYEGTHFWVDPKRDFVGVFMTQIFGVQEGGQNKDNRIRGILYQDLLNKN